MRADFAARAPRRARLFPLSIERSLGLILLIFIPAFAFTFLSVWYIGVISIPEGEVVIKLSVKPYEKHGNAVFSRQDGIVTTLNDDADDRNIPGDSRSRTIVYEYGRPLGPGHSTFKDVRDLGAGRFAHLKNFGLIFSSSDNSDPNTNGRTYWLVKPYANRNTRAN